MKSNHSIPINHQFDIHRNQAAENENLPSHGFSARFRDSSRIFAALCGAPIATLGLMLLMNALIQHDLPEPEKAVTFHDGGIFDIPPTIDPVEPDRKIKEIDPVELPPPPVRSFDIDIDGGVSLTTTDFGVTPATGFDPALVDSDTPIRLVAIAPDYPIRAVEREIEGYVDVRFNVTKSGTTENIEIIAYEPSTIFNRAVLKAVAKWRYQPKLEQGEPVETKGVRERLSFKMED